MRRLALILLSWACGQAGLPEPVYLPDSADLFDAPWPTDDRTTRAGLDLSGFPRGDEIDLLRDYLAVVQTLPGWGTSAPLYVPLSELPDETALPDPAASTLPSSPIWLVAIDPQSPHFGERVPLIFERLQAGTYTPHPTLAVSPLPGFTLAPKTQYALIVTTRLAEPDPLFQERIRRDPALADLCAALSAFGLARRRVAVATVFTTRDPLAEMDRLTQAVRGLPLPQLDQPIFQLNERRRYRTYAGAVDGPLWMHGDKPFARVGGGFRYDADGAPLVAEWERLRLAISVPRHTPPPPDGYPIVLYGHGTGGDYRGFAQSSSRLGTAAVLADIGVVGIGFDQPLHGSRGTPNTETSLHSFNYLNPESARAGFRQGALDILWLTRVLASRDVSFTLPDGTPLPLDTSKIAYVGHSHGGITGALALPWLSDRIDGAVFSGAGGALAISIVKRKDPFDIAALIGQLLRLEPHEQLTVLHPVIGLVQLLVEETDPINYAPAWLREDRGYAARATSILLTSGALDDQTDFETADALAISGSLPILPPAWNVAEGYALRDLVSTNGRAVGNVLGWDNSPHTAGISQWEEGDHFVIYQDPRASRLWQQFIETALEGQAVIAP